MNTNCNDTIYPACRIVAIAAALAVSTNAAAASPPNHADTTAQSVRIVIRKGDLGNPAAVRGLFNRIDEAAMEACGAYRSSFPEIRREVRLSNCWKRGVSTAVAELQDLGLATYFAQRIDSNRAAAGLQD